MNKTIVVIGDSYVNLNNAEKIFKDEGLNNYKIEMHTDYKKLKKLNYEKYKYNDSYVAILCGPIPHSTNQKYYSSSILNEMETCDGYPLVVRLSANSTYKITNSSIRKGLEEFKEKYNNRYCVNVNVGELNE